MYLSHCSWPMDTRTAFALCALQAIAGTIPEREHQKPTSKENERPGWTRLSRTHISVQKRSYRNFFLWNEFKPKRSKLNNGSIDGQPISIYVLQCALNITIHADHHLVVAAVVAAHARQRAYHLFWAEKKSIKWASHFNFFFSHGLFSI